MQVPPLQFVEQQSAAYVHASPSVLQVAPLPPGGSAAHFEPVQTPEQHCVLLAQAWSIWRQTFDEQVAPAVPAFGQFREQHWASELQASPGAAQRPPLSTQRWFEPQTPEQHCESAAQAVVVSSMQDGVIGWAHVLEALQYPEQQSPFAVHATVSSLHCEGGGTQTVAPRFPSQYPVQHSCGNTHDVEFVLHWVTFGSTQVPPGHAPRQQSDGPEHTAPTAPQTPPAATHMWFAQLPEQHSGPVVHAASSALSVHSGGVPGSLFFLHPVAVSASTASADTSKVESLGVRMRSSRGRATSPARAGRRVSHAFRAPAM